MLVRNVEAYGLLSTDNVWPLMKWLDGGDYGESSMSSLELVYQDLLLLGSDVMISVAIVV